MDNISDLLKNKGVKEPEEISLIKKFIMKKYQEEVGVKVEVNKITVLVRSSALANTIRMDVAQIQKACNTTKRIAIYIGNY